MLATLQTTRSALPDLFPEWGRLRVTSPFSLPEFAAAWLRDHPEVEPAVMAVRDEAGRLIGLAPWCVSGQGGWKVLTGIGSDEAWYHDPIVAPGVDPGMVARAIAGASRGVRWDLARLALGAAWGDALGAAFATRCWVASDAESWRQGYEIDLAEGWAAYLAGRSSSFRKTARRLERRLVDLVATWYRAPLERERELLEKLLTFHAARWAHVRDWSRPHAQLRALVGGTPRAGEIAIFALDVGDRVAAVELTARFGARVFSLLAGLDPDFAGDSVGTALQLRNLEHWCRAGASTVDLGPVWFEWKERFGGRPVPMRQLLAAPRSSLPGSCRLGWKSVLKPWLRGILRPARELR